MILEVNRKLLGVSGTNDPISLECGAFATLMWSTTQDHQSRGIPVSRAEAVTIYHRLGELLTRAEADNGGRS